MHSANIGEYSFQSRAAAKAGLAITPLPKHAVGPGLRILNDADGVPDLPSVAYAVRRRDDAVQPALAAFEAALRERAPPTEA